MNVTLSDVYPNIADWVVIMVVESAVTGRPSFSHEIVGSGKPRTEQIRLALLLITLLTGADDDRMLGGTM